MGPMVLSWQSRGLGFCLDASLGPENQERVTHSVWADNINLYSNNRANAVVMMDELSRRFMSRGLRWEPAIMN